MAILDQFGRPMRPAELKREVSAPGAIGVRSIYTSETTRGMTPARIASVLRAAEQGDARRYVELAEIMEERDLHYLSVLSTRKRQVSQLKVTVEAADDSPEAEEDADLVRQWLRSTEIEDEMFDLLDAIGKGYSVSEIVWDTSEGDWWPVRLEHRLPQWFEFDPETGSTLMLREQSGLVELAPAKFVTHLHAAKSGLPIRGGLARAAAWAWMFKLWTDRDWARFCEAYGMPYRVGKYGPSATGEDVEKLVSAVRRIASDAAAVIPEGMSLELVRLDGAATRAEVYDRRIAWIDASLSKAVLGQTLTTDAGERGSGSYALGKVHDEVRHDIERSDARQLAATLTRDVAIPLVILNRKDARKPYPRIRIGRETEIDPAVLADFVTKTVPLGLRVRADEVRAAIGLSHPGDDDEVLRPPAAPAVPELARAQAAAEPGDRLRDAIRTADDDPAGALAARARLRTGPEIDRWIAAVRSQVGRAASLDALRAWLTGAAIAELEDNAVAERLSEALAAAHLAGRYDVGEGRLDGAAAKALAAAMSAEAVDLPFSEQIDFFRSKVSLPSAAWTDLMQSQHDVAFVVAGAAKLDLVDDLRKAVDAAIADGETIGDFRKRFDEIVDRSGWEYKGGRDWRTRVIYATNVRSSYAAGRWRQIQQVRDTRPYVRYRHSPAVEDPRPEHVAWDGLVLRADDPWLETHTPMNGWGCQCYLETLSERDLQRLGKAGPDRAPPIEWREVAVGVGGPSPRTVRVPEGIDPGFAYSPGREGSLGHAARAALLQSIGREPKLAAAGLNSILARPRVLAALQDEFRAWRASPQGESRFPLGAAPGAVMRERPDMGTAVVTIDRQALLDVDEADLDRLPLAVAEPEAVYFDGEWEVVYDAGPAAAGGTRLTVRASTAGGEAVVRYAEPSELAALEALPR